ncbi:hypothetical protein [Sphaerisporangium sp. TRM90804]|uniref:hypothetical protein n=1 Tax=Sphaerisporangium sp. TRM90804 TaxID=3031113 RepID=UPI00244C4E41|nr:hypothetical protein [Sphaerisporangium sp. TRM90804]MDH2423825.1 hypothetical protein [Sphaerisporangium sp. TRM90804]
MGYPGDRQPRRQPYRPYEPPQGAGDPRREGEQQEQASDPGASWASGETQAPGEAETRRQAPGAASWPSVEGHDPAPRPWSRMEERRRRAEAQTPGESQAGPAGGDTAFGVGRTFGGGADRPFATSPAQNHPFERLGSDRPFERAQTDPFSTSRGGASEAAGGGFEAPGQGGSFETGQTPRRPFQESGPSFETRPAQGRPFEDVARGPFEARRPGSPAAGPPPTGSFARPGTGADPFTSPRTDTGSFGAAPGTGPEPSGTPSSGTGPFSTPRSDTGSFGAAAGTGPFGTSSADTGSLASPRTGTGPFGTSRSDTGSFGTPGPSTGSFGVPGPGTGSFGAVGPGTGSFGAVGPEEGRPERTGPGGRRSRSGRPQAGAPETGAFEPRRAQASAFAPREGAPEPRGGKTPPPPPKEKRRREPEDPGRRSRGPVILAGGVAALLVAVGAGIVWMSNADEPVSTATPSTTRPTGPVPMVGAPEGKHGFAASRKTDPQPLTLDEVFGRKKLSANGRSYTMTVRRADKKCKDAVQGAAIQKALESGACTQLLRASFRDVPGNLIGTVGVANLKTSAAAAKAAKVGNGGELEDYVKPLQGKDAVTKFLGSGDDSYAIAWSQGHYLVLLWFQYKDGHKPNKAELKRLNRAAVDITEVSVFSALDTRALTGARGN